MAKSMRCKRVKRLRALRREMVEPLYEKKDAAKQAAMEAALAAPKLPVRVPTSKSMEITPSASTSDAPTEGGDAVMADGNQNSGSLKPVGKRMKKKLKIGKRKGRGKGMLRKKHV